ncbi:Ribonuclease H-like superfamily protein [Striga hermonthica]|uniref:Ribonuclease H-like superfamily protein n=1 Tax=Striga hermonthica TaxID=68872 RepID=A0A9N7MS69_STRHE|nr:Ribonuclease H-like superfamily protein [Striga hermonthica]
MAGRVVLAQAVINALPYYTMQSVHLPNSISAGLEKRVRRFIWGAPRKRKLSLIKWDEVCLPKDLGGLGIKRQRLMNEALLMKLGWKFLTDQRSLWTQIWKVKYGTNPFDVMSGRRKPSSGMFQAVQKIWKWVVSGTRWAVPAVPPPREELGCDQLYWGPSATGKFTTRSAYEFLDAEGASRPIPGSLWRAVWKWSGPQRIRHFLWLLVKNHLLTNVERRRRHLTALALCESRGQAEDYALHVCRECPMAAEIWRRLLPSSTHHEFFSLDLESWLQLNGCLCRLVAILIGRALLAWSCGNYRAGVTSYFSRGSVVMSRAGCMKSQSMLLVWCA